MFLAAARAALSQSTAYVPAMSSPYGITLDREWSEWAAKSGVSSTVAAALFLISERHPPHEVMAKLTLGEVEQVAKIVRRWPDCFRLDREPVMLKVEPILMMRTQPDHNVHNGRPRPSFHARSSEMSRLV